MILKLSDIYEKHAIVDEEDYERVSKYKWYLTDENYVMCIHPILGTISLHRLILGMQKGDKVLVDHKNRNPLDCRKVNLRYCTKYQNSQNRKKPSFNTSGYKGVSWDNDRDRWVVNIMFNNQKKKVGRYHNLLDAAKAYDQAALKYHGKFAVLNFPKRNEYL